MEQILNNVKAFMQNGKITQFPVKNKLKLCCIFYLAGKIEKGREYSEKEINVLLNEWHTFKDPAVLRRYLCDYGFLERKKDGTCYHLSESPPSAADLNINVERKM